jgi:hypothetical protein
VQKPVVWGKSRGSRSLWLANDSAAIVRVLQFGHGGDKMTEDELRRYRDCAHALAEVADPFIKRRLLDLAHDYEERLHGKTVKPCTIANLPSVNCR